MNNISAIIKEKNFLELLSEKSLLPIPLSETIRLDAKLSLSEDDFLTFAVNHGQEVFYHYSYPDISTILICGSTFDNATGYLSRLISAFNISENFISAVDREIFPESYSSEEYQSIKFSRFEQELFTDIRSFNKHSDVQSSIIPTHFTAAVLFQGRFLGIEKDADTEDMADSSSALLRILGKYEEIAYKNNEEKEAKKQEIRDRLKEYLLNDKDFSFSSNKELREEYGYDLWKKREFKWIQEAFGSYHGYPAKDYFLFLERVYKEIRLPAGIRVGSQRNQ